MPWDRSPYNRDRLTVYGQQVISKRRVAKHGGLDTEARGQPKLLDLVKSKTDRIDSRFLGTTALRAVGYSRCGNPDFRRVGGREALHPERVYEPLIVALLAVNNYPLEKAWQIRGALESAGLFNPEILASAADLVVRLRTAGYDRGAFLTDLAASRLQSLGAFLMNIGQDRALEVMSSGTPEEAHALLIKIKGVGPTVIRNFLLLRGQAPKS